MITNKKIPFKISKPLREYLIEYGREIAMPIKYTDLARYENSIPLYDKHGEDTLWVTVFYSQSDMADIHLSLKKMYAILQSDGDMSVIEHLYIDRIDLCMYGNTNPFRIRIVNKYNDIFDYFYVKVADASRVYGLELEHMLSPNQIGYYTDGNTLIEEHILGIPGDQFFKNYLNDKRTNKSRFAKEFIKFNERCFIRLLGDMHSSNYVVQIIHDLDDVHYRIRAIDFDQQSYEGRKNVYLPQFYKQNNPIISEGLKLITAESMHQYQIEERARLAQRLSTWRYRIKELGDAVIKDNISLPEHTETLKYELAEHYNDPNFLKCESMGEIVRCSLRTLLK